MALKTVKVPRELEALFSRAEEVVSRYFSERRDRPEEGTIEISGERYVLVRAASLSVEFFALVRDLYGKGRESEADDFARNILFDLSHAVARQDARTFHEKMDLRDPIARLSAGPVHFSHSGWAFVDISPDSKPDPNDYYLIYDHPYSFESDAWLRSGRTSNFPVCIMNAGYSSGWCEESFGITLVAAEIMCRARGDATCRFIMAPPDRIEAHVGRGYQIPDFFARKRMEDDLKRRFAEEMKEREEAEKRLRQTHKLEAVGRLAGGIAHDFNNLMAIVITRSAMLARKLSPGDPMRNELEQITEAGERASNLTQQLLAFSRAQVLKRERLDLNAIVTELGRLLGPLLGEDLELDLQLSPDTGWVEGDCGQIEQVITNLVVNGRDAMPVGGRLVIATGRRDVDEAGAGPELAKGCYAELSVEDAGRGMDEETLSRIFEPFFTTKEYGKGTGLGLATAYGIVKQSGGNIEVESEPGRGTRFKVLLPRVDDGSRAAPVARIHDRMDELAQEVLLLVEDNREVRAALADLLRDEGYEVIEAPDAVAAEAAAADEKQPIHLLLTDVVMPKQSGRMLALRLRDKRPNLNVLFMSGYSPDTALLDGVPGAVFIMKPFRPAVLLHKLRQLLKAGSR
jgi:signal transduction histidine kinase